MHDIVWMICMRSKFGSVWDWAKNGISCTNNEAQWWQCTRFFGFLWYSIEIRTVTQWGIHNIILLEYGKYAMWIPISTYNAETGMFMYGMHVGLVILEGTWFLLYCFVCIYTRDVNLFLIPVFKFHICEPWVIVW